MIQLCCVQNVFVIRLAQNPLFQSHEICRSQFRTNQHVRDASESAAWTHFVENAFRQITFDAENFALENRNQSENVPNSFRCFFFLLPIRSFSPLAENIAVKVNVAINNDGGRISRYMNCQSNRKFNYKCVRIWWHLRLARDYGEYWLPARMTTSISNRCGFDGPDECVCYMFWRQNNNRVDSVRNDTFYGRRVSLCDRPKTIAIFTSTPRFTDHRTLPPESGVPATTFEREMQTVTNGRCSISGHKSRERARKILRTIRKRAHLSVCYSRVTRIVCVSVCFFPATATRPPDVYSFCIRRNWQASTFIVCTPSEKSAFCSHWWTYNSADS